METNSFNPDFLQYSKYTPYLQQIGGLGSNLPQNNISMADQSSHFYDRGPMPFQPTAIAVSHDPSVFPNYTNDFPPANYISPTVNNPAPPVTLHPPISTQNPIPYCSTQPKVEFLDSDEIVP